MNQAELRQTFNTISRNFETANETAQVGFYSFTQTYIDPCISGLKACLSDCTAPCFPNLDDQFRRRRGRSHGRADFDFDFYDDWEQEEGEGTGGLGWGNDELDSLLAGRGSSQPRRQRAMSYGARGRGNDPDSDPIVIPKSSYLGFLDRLPFKIGSRGLKYKPSAAGLQENPGGLRIRDVEAEPLIEADGHIPDFESHRNRGHARQRSATEASRSTTTSRSARSDLIMSDEDDDAVPLDDEFGGMLSRRTTSSGADDYVSSGKTVAGRRPNISRVSTRTFSSRSTQSNRSRKSSGKKSLVSEELQLEAGKLHDGHPSMLDLKLEEEQARQEEEMEIKQKRTAAVKLAQATGLSNEESKPPVSTTMTEAKDATPGHNISHRSPQPFLLSSPISTEVSDCEMEPFPEISTRVTDIKTLNNPP